MRRKFFQVGKNCERGYRNVREGRFWEPAREYTERLWDVYEPYADAHFLQDAKKHFLQRYWEMYLMVALMAHGVSPVRAGGVGPEFYFLHANRRVWTEAIAPGPGEGPDRVPEDLSRLSFSVPTEKIILRYTSALSAKRNKLLADQARGIISKDEPYVLGINCRDIPHAWFGGVIPYMIQAFLPFGPLTLTFDRRTKEITGRSFERREAIPKQSGASVSTKPFLDPAFSGVSAVVHSGVDAANAPVVLGAEFFVLHNPMAANPLPIELFSHWRQYVFADDQVRVVEPIPAVNTDAPSAALRAALRAPVTLFR